MITHWNNKTELVYSYEMNAADKLLDLVGLSFKLILPFQMSTLFDKSHSHFMLCLDNRDHLFNKYHSLHTLCLDIVS